MKEKMELDQQLKMLVHGIINNATEALRRYDNDDEHWRVLLSLLRYRAEEYAEVYQRFERGEEE